MERLIYKSMSAKNEMLVLSNVILFDLPTQEFWRA